MKKEIIVKSDFKELYFYIQIWYSSVYDNLHVTTYIYFPNIMTVLIVVLFLVFFHQIEINSRFEIPGAKYKPCLAYSFKYLE